MNEEQRATDTRELMIRLDERLKGVQAILVQIQTSQSSKVDNDEEYRRYLAEHKIMWDLRSRALGYIAAWTIGVSVIVEIAIAYLQKVLFK